MHVAAALSSGSNIHVAAVNGLCVRKFVHFQLNMADVEYYVIVKWGLRNTFCSCAPARGISFSDVVDKLSQIFNTHERTWFHGQIAMADTHSEQKAIEFDANESYLIQ